MYRNSRRLCMGRTFFAGLLLSSVVPVEAMSQQSNQVFDSSSLILSNERHSASVSIKDQAGEVKVKLLDENQYPPKSVAITFINHDLSPSSSLTLTLQALDSASVTSPSYSGFFPKGVTHTLSQSFIGIELNIPWPTGEPSVLKSVNPFWNMGSFFSP